MAGAPGRAKRLVLAVGDELVVAVRRADVEVAVEEDVVRRIEEEVGLSPPPWPSSRTMPSAGVGSAHGPRNPGAPSRYGR